MWQPFFYIYFVNFEPSDFLAVDVTYALVENIDLRYTRGTTEKGANEPTPEIPHVIGNYIHYNIWYEISYPFPNFNGCTVEVWEWIK